MPSVVDSLRSLRMSAQGLVNASRHLLKNLCSVSFRTSLVRPLRQKTVLNTTLGACQTASSEIINRDFS